VQWHYRRLTCLRVIIGAVCVEQKKEKEKKSQQELKELAAC
jgi:hypothetical protein